MHDDLRKAVDVLRSGGIILYPTDLAWGLGCDATNPEAVKKIYEIKQEKSCENMTVLMENPALLDRYVDEPPEVAWDLVELSAKPLTVIFQGAKNLATNLVSDDKCISIRFTKEEFTSKLLQRFRRPIVATSANIIHRKKPEYFDEVSDDIKSSVDYIIMFRQDDHSPITRPSIIKLGSGGQIDILRK